MRGKPTTIGMTDLRHIRYAARSTPLKWHTDRFIQTTSCEAVRWNKFWIEKIHGWFCSHFHKNMQNTIGTNSHQHLNLKKEKRYAERKKMQ